MHYDANGMKCMHVYKLHVCMSDCTDKESVYSYSFLIFYIHLLSHEGTTSMHPFANKLLSIRFVLSAMRVKYNNFFSNEPSWFYLVRR